MRNWLAASLLVLAPMVAIAAEAPPEWAYPAAPAGYQPPPDNGQPKHVAGSTKTFTEKDVNNIHNPPDWFPDEHPPQPDLVAHGKEGVNACAQCHLATGYGHPESANLAGLPAGYIEEQLQAFKSGERKSSLAGRSANMINFAKAMNEADMKQAAVYFSSIKPVVWTKVKEAASVPKTFVGEGNMRFASPGAQTEAIGRRIIEIPEEEERRQGPRSAFAFRRLCADGKHQGGRGSGHHGWRQDHSMHRLPRHRFQGHRQCAGPGRPFGDLYFPPAQRHPEGHSPWQCGGLDAAGGRQIVGGRYDRARGLHGVPHAVRMD